MAWEHEQKESKTSAVMPVVALCLPHRGNLPAEFVESVWGPLRYKPTNWCHKIPLTLRAPSLPLARNRLAQEALDRDVTHLLWVDSDGVMETPLDPNEALKMLYLQNVPIVGCIYRAKQKLGFYYAAWMKAPGGYTPIGGWTGNWIRVDVTGLHFCLIKREVFEKVPKPWFHWEEGPPSEDFYFFEKAKQAGYEVNIFTEVKLSHIGTLKVKSDGSITTLDV